MNIRQFRSELAEAFQSAGFHQRRAEPPMKARIWVLPGAEVERGFCENAMRRPWGFLLSGVLTLDVPAFRSWLKEQFPSDQHGVLSHSLLSRHVANEPDMFFAVEDEPPSYEEWVKQIRRRLAALPDTIEGLLGAEREHAQGLKVVWDGHVGPKAWSYFKSWAAGAPPASPPPYMLPDGQIVDAAANDPD